MLPVSDVRAEDVDVKGGFFDREHMDKGFFEDSQLPPKLVRPPKPKDTPSATQTPVTPPNVTTNPVTETTTTTIPPEVMANPKALEEQIIHSTTTTTQPERPSDAPPRTFLEKKAQDLVKPAELGAMTTPSSRTNEAEGWSVRP